METWREKSDLGLRLVANVKEVLRISDHWLVDRGARGFTWWAGDFAQSIWSDLGNFHNGVTLFRLHCETELLRGDGHAQEQENRLARYVANSTLSAAVYDRPSDLYKLHCSVYAHDENVEWLKRAFLAAVVLQQESAHEEKGLESECGLRFARTEHPTNGMRQSEDPVFGWVKQFMVPVGREGSRWQGSPEWNEAKQCARRLSHHAVSDEETYIEAEFDCATEHTPIRFEATTRKPHPTLGAGLTMNIVVPVILPFERRVHVALELNEKERQDWNWMHDFGSWMATPTDLAFHCFVPNIAFSPGSLKDLVHDMALRASWANEHLRGIQ